MVSGPERSRAARPELKHGLQEGASLQRLYRGYLDRQASAFLSLVPTEGVRPLYKVARSWAVAEGVHEDKDPLANLLRYLTVRLPLPPYQVWLADFQEHREAHLEALASAGPGAESAQPVTVELRPVELDGRWYASLGIFRRGAAWRGFISFRREDEADQVRTADVFRGDDAEEIRRRFRSFDEETLWAFLRSALP